MASIGPALPPQLAKRKRTPDDEETSTDSPASKIRVSESTRTNEDEVELDSDSDDGYGPPAPKAISRPSSIGPAPPPSTSAGPSLSEKNTSSTSPKSEEKTTGPSAPLPPTTHTTNRSIGPTLPPTSTDEIDLESEDDDVGPAPPEPKRVQGPAPPPADLSERPPADSESDSDDDYGPALPSSTSHQKRQARALEAAEAEAATVKAPQRDEWMLAPPSAGGYRASDPTKIKARRFNSGPRAGASNGGEISSIWTETPEEKRKRLENAVLGRDTTAGSSASSHPPRPQSKTKEDVAQAARIQNYTESTRGRSLYEEHQAARARGDNPKTVGAKSWVDEEEDDPSKRTFDKEKDMKLGGRIGAAQRRELLNKAADFGGRFAKGKYL
ncbi:hypothetical protein F5B22DRAFT_595222 [Xylaria bambusicola]|uniref:uncharacterized protein n=1 Tax=Xylaria bambusicola TaxID=326684 RepID=UPI0020071EAE|nr:uncharacterized protein F5B22DRAFT_595222 [Xylaria bambusicola]KAI0521518.1 hypothetical protein F5B22DRAFT_595222 [Xylaria bambusicola]